MSMVDPNGRRVLTFTSHIQNLGRVAELTDAVIDIATSGAWRDYHMATGHEAWRDAELDNFLIACGMHYEDDSRVLAYNARAKALAPMMDKAAENDRRRPLAEAATAWHSPTGESLLDRAKHLGWLRDSGVMRASPIPERARAQAKHGMTLDEHARESRRQRISGGTSSKAARRDRQADSQRDRGRHRAALPHRPPRSRWRGWVGPRPARPSLSGGVPTPSGWDWKASGARRTLGHRPRVRL